MAYQNILRGWPLLVIGLLTACTPNNIPLGPNESIQTKPDNTVEIEAAREGIFTIKGGELQPLPLSQRVTLDPSQEVRVDEKGRAFLHFGEFATIEMLQTSQIQIQQFSIKDQVAEINLFQNGGVIIVELTQAKEIEPRLTLQTAYATINAANTRFAVIHEANNPLEWIVGLAAEDDDLQVTANGVTKAIVGGQARWVAPLGEPGPVISASQNAEVWLNGARNNSPQLELGEVLLAPANLLVDTGAMTRLPSPGEPFEIRRDVQGSTKLRLDPQGIFGSPIYTLEDCNGDGLQDIAVQNGVLSLDFREMLGRVHAVDVTILNRDKPGNGSLQGFDPAGVEIGRQQLEVEPGLIQTLSLRAEQRYYEAKLVLGNGCFLGFSLTPPGQTATETIQVRPITENLQSNVVVNVLATPSERPSENGQFQAPFSSETLLIQIDGAQTDWETLVRQTGQAWTDFSTVTYDESCATRFPTANKLTDLAGRVQFAYDHQYLYAAFVVNDDGLTTYTGSDQRYFLGDSPQLLLDLDLNGDFEETQLSGDDVQIDLLPDVNAPRAAFWQLSNLSSRPFNEARVAVTPTETGYFLEAALPWQGLGPALQPGDRLGIVASISDNDTPNTNTQECIISTSPQRDWRNPTTWGTVVLRPEER
jgi:hypothetical protein